MQGISGAESGPLEALLGRADRRRRARMALASGSTALWPGLAAAIGVAIFWRLAGAGSVALAASAALVAAAAGAGVLLGLTRRDLLAAAAELDRRAGLEAALATGLEVRRGRVAGPLAGAALAEAERAASLFACAAEAASAERRLAGEDGGPVPLAPLVPVLPRGMRYLAVPAAVLAGVVLIPGATARRGGGTFLAMRGATAVGAKEAAAAEIHKEAGRRRDGRPLAPRRPGPAALAEYRAEKARAAGRVRLPAPPRGTRDRRRKHPDRAAGAGAREADATGGGPDAGMVPEEAAAQPGGAGRGPVDLREATIIRERFPGYEELVRRYFAGPRG